MSALHADRRLSAWLLAPGFGWLLMFLVIPCLLVLVYSFVERGAYGGIDWLFTWKTTSARSIRCTWASCSNRRRSPGWPQCSRC